jgi:WD40 repeat protein
LLTSADGVVRVWDARTGKELRQWSCEESPVLAVAFAPDSKTYAAVENHQALRVRDWATGRDLLPLAGHRNSVRALAVAANGRTVATAGEDEAVFLWDTLTGKQLRPLTGFDRRVHFLAFALHGRTVFGAGEGLLIAWDVVTGQQRYRRAGDKDAPTFAAALSGDGKILALSPDEKTILLLDADTGQELRKVAGRGRYLTFAPNGGALLDWTDDERLHAWDLRTGECRVTSCKGLQSVYAVAPRSAVRTSSSC